MLARHRLAAVVSACVLLLHAAGCLSLGGKTTYTTDNPQVDGRLKALETRVGALEHVISGPPTAPIPMMAP